MQSGGPRADCGWDRHSLRSFLGLLSSPGTRQNLDKTSDKPVVLPIVGLLLLSCLIHWYIASSGTVCTALSASKSHQYPQFEGLQVSIVYYAFLNPHHNWKGLVSAQLTDLISLNLSSIADIHVVLSAPADNYFDQNGENLVNEGEEFVKKVLSTAIVHRSVGNKYEYPGIRLIWDLAQASRSPSKHILLYFHSKGMPDAVAFQWLSKQQKYAEKGLFLVLSRSDDTTAKSL